MVYVCGVLCAFLGGVSSCPLVAYVPDSGPSGPAGCRLWSSGRVTAFLSALLLCLWCTTFEYGSISRFKGVFSAFYGVGVGLCCLGALRGLCGFCARVELGGLKACGVFAFVIPLFAFLFTSLLLLLSRFLLSLLVLCLSSLFVLLHCLCCFLFPFGLHAKRKDAKCFLCVLSCPMLWAC